MTQEIPARKDISSFVEGGVKQTLTAESEQRTLAELRKELTELELLMGSADQDVRDMQAEPGADAAVGVDLGEVSLRMRDLNQRREWLVAAINEARVALGGAGSSQESTTQSEARGESESARDLQEKVEREFSVLEKALSNWEVASKLGQRYEPVYNNKLSLRDRLERLSRPQDYWIDDYLSPEVKAMGKEVSQLEPGYKREQLMKQAYVERVQKEKPKELVAIDKFFEEKAFQYFQDRSSSQFLKYKVLNDGTAITDLDNPGRTPELQQLAERGLKFMARTLNMGSDFAQVKAGYEALMSTWNARTLEIEREIEAEFAAKAVSLGYAYQAQVKRVKESVSFQKDMAAIARTRAIVTPLVARYELVAPPRAAQEIERPSV